MATSPNYGWLEPDNTDLVKNGALAIRTLGNAIDSTMATMVPKSIVDAKGDLIAGTAADTTSRLAVGANGETLVADSSTTTGLRYNPQNALANPVINGGFDIWQRGTTFSNPASPYYTADRWQAVRQGAATGITISRQATGDTTNLPNIQYCARVQRDSGNTNTSDLIIGQSFETTNSIPFAGKTITLSFYARKGALFSATSNLLTVVLTSGTGTDQNSAFTGSFTNAANVILQTATLTNDWQRFAFTATVGATATQLAPRFIATTSGTAGATDYFEITGVQIDLGTYTSSTAPSFRRSGGTIQGELAACRRYLPAINIAATGSATFLGYAYTTNSAIIPISFDVPARVGPTGITTPTVNTSNFTVRNKSNGDATITSLAFDISGVNGATLLAGATLTTGDVCRLVVNNTSYILFTGCEL